MNRRYSLGLPHEVKDHSLGTAPMAIRLIAFALLVSSWQIVFILPTAAQTADESASPTAPLDWSGVTIEIEEQPLESDSNVETTARHYKYKKYSNVIFAKGDDYRLLCDIYMPVGKGPFPAVLAIHGGAWQHGSKVNMLRHAWKLAGSGYVVLAINYRLAPDHRFPAQIHDCKHAVRWIRSKSEKLNIDPNQIAVFGYSAGGHLAAMLGTTDENDKLEGEIEEGLQKYSSRVQCVVIGGAPCEFGWIKSRALVGWLGESPEENPQLYATAAPITHISPEDPPFAIFHGSADDVVPPESSKLFHDKLLAAGIDSRYESVVGKGHLATFTDTSWLDDAIEFMDEKLNRKHHE